MRIRPLAAFTVLAVTGGAGILLVPAAADSAVLYVNNAASAGCSDSGTGTEDQPYCTVQAAAAVVQPGQTVDVTPGNYTGEVDITRSGTPDHPITFTFTPNPTHPVWGPALNSGGVHAFTISGAHDIVIHGFMMGTKAEAVVITDSSRITLDTNRVGNSGNVQTTGTRAAGISVQGHSSDVTVSRNLMYGAGAAEVTVGPGVSGTVITTNDLNSGGGAGVLATDAPGTIVTSNTLHEACTPAISLAGASAGSSVQNNLVVDIGSLDSNSCVSAPAQNAEISVSSQATTQTTVDYNLIQPPSSGAALYAWAGTPYADPATLHTATGQAGHDIVAATQLSGTNLTEGSAAIDSANADAPGELPTDARGLAPVDDPLTPNTGTGSGFRDRGAHEFQDPYRVSHVTVTPTRGPYPLQVAATAVEYNPWSTPASYTFDFGDGSAPVTSSTPTASHVYTSPPTSREYYTVTVQATTGTRTTVPVSAPVWVTSPAPLVPVLKVTENGNGDALSVDTDTSGSTDAWTITDRVIDFGDGTGPIDNHNTTNLFHTYARPGTYTITLTEHDEGGNTATTTQRVTVGTRLWNLLARDTTGGLWQYQGTGHYNDLFQPRTQIGSGWQAYTAITSLSGQRADGTGDLVARDASGVLWLYRGSGDPAAPLGPRTSLGGGWNTYNTLIGAGDLTGDGHPDLLARDTTGVLWLYPGTGNPSFGNRIRLGAGWNTYNTLIGAGDITGDGHPDLLARDTTGVLWLYPGTGNPAAPFLDRTNMGGGWNIYNTLI